MTPHCKMKSIWLYMYVSILGSVASNSLTCMVSDGWKLRNMDGRCYKGFMDREERFQDANNLCKTHNAYLTSVKDVRQYFFIAGAVLGGINTKFWVGLYRLDNDYYWYEDNTIYDESYGKVSRRIGYSYTGINTAYGNWYQKICYSNTTAHVVCIKQPTCTTGSTDWRCATTTETVTASTAVMTKTITPIHKSIITDSTLPTLSGTSTSGVTHSVTDTGIVISSSKKPWPDDENVTSTTAVTKSPETISTLQSIDKDMREKQQQEEEERVKRNAVIGGSVLALILLLLLAVGLAIFLIRREPTIRVSFIEPEPGSRTARSLQRTQTA